MYTHLQKLLPYKLSADFHLTCCQQTYGTHWMNKLSALQFCPQVYHMIHGGEQSTIMDVVSGMAYPRFSDMFYQLHESVCIILCLTLFLAISTLR